MFASVRVFSGMELTVGTVTAKFTNPFFFLITKATTTAAGTLRGHRRLLPEALPLTPT